MMTAMEAAPTDLKQQAATAFDQSRRAA